MEKLKLFRVVAMLLFCSFVIDGQAQIMQDSLVMSLDECLEYAKENSITLQKAKLQIENSQADEVSAKGTFLPTVSGSVSQSLSSTPLETSSSIGTYSGSYGLDLSMTLYSGGRNRALLQQSGITTQITDLALSEYENSIEVAVTEIYVEILYAIEQIAAAETSLELSKKSQERGEAFLEVGSINSVDYAQLESATASYEYNLIVAKTQLNNLYVSLKHLLEISQDIKIVVKEPNLNSALLVAPISTVSDVYLSALEFRPEIQSTKLSVSLAELDTKIAQSGYLPTLSLSAGTGISHSSASDYTFSSQLRNNFNTSAGLHLSIPIFSNYKNKTAVIKAKNSVKTATLSQTEAEKDLYQVIETLHNNAINAEAQYAVAEYKLKAVEKSLNLTTQQYEVGMKNTIELLTEQDNYSQAYQEYLTNKYQLLYNKAILNYYKTNVINI